MEELQELEIEFKTHKNENGMLCLDNYEELKKILEFSKTACENLPVENEMDYKLAKKYRATVNKTSKAITSLKTSFLKDYVYDYDTKTKDLNSILKETANIVDTKIKTFEEGHGLAKQKLITLTFKTYSKEDADKLMAYATGLNILGEIK